MQTPKIAAPRGTKDFLESEILKFRELEKISRSIFEKFFFKEIKTPIFEERSLFVRTLGEYTDVVEKQLLEVRHHDNIYALRPEGTAPVIRAYLENSLDKKYYFCKLFYIGPMFRGERPQKGRLRQFHHIGAEIIGSDSPYSDLEIIKCATQIIKEFGIRNYTLILNSLGCSKDKKRFVRILKESLRPFFEDLCENCKRRFEKNVLRILDCKEKSCQRIKKSLFLKREKILCKECLEHFEKLKELLKEFSVGFKEDIFLVRGLDYYTQTVFEFVSPELGAQNAFGGGGRYNDLMVELGGKSTPCIGFALGVERMLLLKKEDESLDLDIFVISLEKDYHKRSFELIYKLREEDFKVETDFQGKSLKSQMRRANSLKAKFCILIGKEEFEKELFTLKEMDTGKEFKLKEENLISFLKERVKKC